MLKLWSTRTSALQYGTWVVRIKFDHCGDITSRTHKLVICIFNVFNIIDAVLGAEIA